MTRCIGIGVQTPENSAHFDRMFCELGELCIALSLKLDYTLVQNLPMIHPLSYIGRGKLDELQEVVAHEDIDLLIFNDELSSRQFNYLSEFFPECDILDRTSLILSIFEKRAHTKEAILQVDIAKLNYQLPRLVGSRKDMIGQLGGSGFRGSGETQLELDRRVLYHDLNRKKKELKAIVAQRQNQRRSRKQTNLPTVSLVGYTNSGKSTLMNAFLKANHLEKTVYEKDMLFATLETSTRMIRRYQQLPFLLTDTVGFISYLPHDLVEAFKSTLEEIQEADLLLFVIDVSDPSYQEQIETTKEVLAQLNVKDIPILYVYNKKDLLTQTFVHFEQPYVLISAKDAEDIDRLDQTIRKMLFKDTRRYHCFIPYDQGELYAKINRTFQIVSTIFSQNGIDIVFEATKKEEAMFRDYMVEDTEDYEWN